MYTPRALARDVTAAARSSVLEVRCGFRCVMSMPPFVCAGRSALFVDGAPVRFVGRRLLPRECVRLYVVQYVALYAVYISSMLPRRMPCAVGGARGPICDLAARGTPWAGELDRNGDGARGVDVRLMPCLVASLLHGALRFTACACAVHPDMHAYIDLIS